MTNRKTVLVVDDSSVSRTLLEETLCDEYVVLQAENGKEALELLDKHSVTAIILDLMMPVMDGSQFLNVLRSNPDLESIPVIIITADSSDEQRKKIIAMGANDVIYKPFIDDLVKLRVKNVIEYRHRKAETMKSVVSEAAKE